MTTGAELRTGRRPAWVEVDLGAVRHNVAAMAARAAPAAVCAVVKADGYGHGAVPVSVAALEAGASWLAVALPEEGAALRDAGIPAPILVLSQPAPDQLALVVAADLRCTLFTHDGVDALADAVAAGATGRPVAVHVKVDSGMHRIGVRPDDAAALVAHVRARPELRFEAIWTHCAVADEPDRPFTAEQLHRFEGVLAGLRAGGVAPPLVHVANSAAAMTVPASRHDLVRVGIALYGIDPGPALAGVVDLRPAMTVKARVSHVQVVPAGEAVSYGLVRPCPVATVVATVPLGYADGVPRRLGAVGGEVVVGGRRRPLAGTVTMDQLLVDCGPAGDPAADATAVGDEVVLLGRQGDEQVRAEEWAERLDTIGYEIVCGMRNRLPRRYVDGDARP